MACLRRLGILLVATASACATPPAVRFVPPVQDRDLRGEANDLQARVAVAWRSLEEHEGGAVLYFRLRIENPGPAAFAPVPAEFELLDAALSSIDRVQGENLPVVLEPGQSATIDLAFRVHGENGLTAFDLGTLTLAARLQGGRWTWNTIFERAEPHVHPSPWSFSFGAGWVID